MSYIENIDEAIQELDEALDTDFRSPIYSCDTQKIREKINEATTKVQELYNIVEMSVRMLKEYPDEDLNLLRKLEFDLMGDYKFARPFFEVKAVQRSYAYEFYWKITLKNKPIGGLKTITQLLLNALSYACPSSELAAHLLSAFRSFIVTMGPLQQLKSRLGWTVMYPDSFSKDALQIKKSLGKAGLDNVWQAFQAGIDNYRLGHLRDAANDLSNALTGIMKAIAKKHGYSGGQLGQHRMFLEKIGYIDHNVREMISQFYSYLAKFRKGQEPPSDEARFLVDLSFSLFGFLAPRMSEFKVDSEVAKNAKKEVKSYVKEQKESEARRIVSKADKNKS